MATKEETGVSEEMVAAAKADLEQKNQEIQDGVRTFKRGGEAKVRVSDLYEFPKDFDMSGVTPMSYLAEPVGEITGNVDTQAFRINEDRTKGLMFDVPARRLEQGRALRTIKHLKPNGVLGQIPFEGQINNTAAGDMSDAIGVKKYQRKGSIIFFDFDNAQPVYCMARNCFAAAMIPELVEEYPQHANVVGSGYCSYDHMVFTEPNLARRSGNGMFEGGVTTTRSRR